MQDWFPVGETFIALVIFAFGFIYIGLAKDKMTYVVVGLSAMSWSVGLVRRHFLRYWKTGNSEGNTDKSERRLAQIEKRIERLEKNAS